jgi:hypothetical protein
MARSARAPCRGTSGARGSFQLEHMIEQPHAFSDRVLDFYEIDRTRFTMPIAPTRHGDRNFRAGPAMSWRDQLTPAQMERASSMIPDALFDRFGWLRR